MSNMDLPDRRERLEMFERDLLLTPATRLSITMWPDLYKDVYGLSDRSFRNDLHIYNEKLNQKYNEALGLDQAKTHKFITKSNGIYHLRNDSQGNPCVLYRHIQNIDSDEWARLAEFIRFNKHLVPDELLHLFKALLALKHADDYGPTWVPVDLAKDGIKAGKENFEVLLSAIKERKVVKALHHNINDPKKSKEVKLLPLLLKEYSNGWISGWYLLAHKVKPDEPHVWPQLNQLYVYALDRLDSIEEEGEFTKKLPPKVFNPANYFKDSLGVFRINLNKPGLAPETVVLQTVVREKAWIYSYLKTYPIHPSQTIVKDLELTQQLTIKLQIENDQELEDFCFKYAKDIKVLEPETLKNQIIERLEKAFENYGINVELPNKAV